MKVFEVRGRAGSTTRHLAETADSLKAGLLPGYEITAEVFGASINEPDEYPVAVGGYVIPIGGPSLMAILLKHHGDELRAWLLANDVAMPQRKARRAA